MELETAKKIIKNNIGYLAPILGKAETAKRYYNVKNDILFTNNKDKTEENILRSADNRVCSSFYPLLVDQKAAYMFTSPPLFDIGDRNANKKITEVLGGQYARNCRRLCISASNCSVGWLHYWIDTDGGGTFKWGVIDGTQIIPVTNNDLEEKLLAVIRTYTNIDEQDGKTYVIYEIWNNKECETFRREINANINDLEYYYIFSVKDALTGETAAVNRYKHGFEEIPFIPFYNNDSRSTDLEKIKGYIDTYDKTYNGFANDLEDIQEVILVLSGYSGTSRREFLEDLHKYKVVKLDDRESGAVDTLNIEIPVEARQTMLDVTRKAIFTQGQGVDAERENFSNSSGVALKFLYSLLELKAGIMQTEFEQGFDKFIKVIAKTLNIKIKNDIIQTWTRTSVSNDLETAQIAQISSGIISNETIIKNHPFVENPDDEMNKIEKEQEKSLLAADIYNSSFIKEQDEDAEE